jgi:hypothetical protein
VSRGTTLKALTVLGVALVAALVFVDLDDNVHTQDVEAVAEAGITRGCNPPANDRYCPDREVTRGEMAAFLRRALDLGPGQGNPFEDDDDSVFEGDIEALAAAGITRGCNPPVNDRYCPDREVTRGEMAAFLRRALDLGPGQGNPFEDDDGSPFEDDIASLEAAGITRGCNPPANDRYCPDDPVQRDQMASFLARGLNLDAGGSHCERWLAEDGSDSSNGSRERPWATLDHALDSISASGCEILVLPGTYEGARVDRRFATPTTIKASIPYTAVLKDTGTVIDVQGAHNVIIEGFEITHAGPGSRGVVVNVEDANDQASSWITIRNNIIHDSYDNDLLKIRSDARYITVKGNTFFNQGPNEQHIDVNGVQDVVIEDNIFSNDFAASGREDPGNTKHFIVVKDSSATGELGSRRVYIRRNVFHTWQGGDETFLQIGNDGKEYHEAIDVTIENNLLLGNSSEPAHSSLGIRGVRDVLFANNTVVGDLPTDGFGLWIAVKEDNPPNQGIELRNNLYVDPTGSMDDFSTGDANGASLHNNLYWNAGEPLSEDGPAPPSADAGAIIADPLLEYDHSELGASIWNGVAFASGETTIRQEFVRIVERYGSIPAGSPAVGEADPAFAPNTDILGRPRDSSPDLGAFEAG